MNIMALSPLMLTVTVLAAYALYLGIVGLAYLLDHARGYN